MTAAVTYAEFGAWYDRHRAEVLEPALEAGLSALESTLEDGLTDRDLSRIRNMSGRVKSKRRTWRKMQQSQYRGQIRTTEDIPEQITDLVGLRLTCTNLRDIETVQAVLQTLPLRGVRGRRFWPDMSTEQDYVRIPKESGYRGWHVSATIELDRPGAGKPVPVVCELQVRTLLQDSWGELTHEDTYSKDGELPPLVEVLSKRIADLFATLDDIAEDLRTELDRIDEASIAEGDESVAAPASLTTSGQAADAASMLLDRWQRLDRPVDLASLAWALQREFGAEISDDWFGYRSFKRFLTAAVPEAEISTGRQTYLMPSEDRRRPPGDRRVEPRTVPAATERRTGSDRAPDSVPPTVDDEPVWADAAARLRAIDRSFPVVETETWQEMFDGLAEAWRRLGLVKVGPNTLNRLTRSARDRAAAAGVQLSRRHLDHVARALVAADAEADPDTQPLPASELADRFASLTVQRMIDLRILDADDVATTKAVTAWLTGR